MQACVRCLAIGFASGVLTVVLAGCDPIARHKVLSTVFDGVPTLPPPEQICTEYAEKRVIAYREELAQQAALARQKGNEPSKHPPYAERKCDDCHDKTKENGLVGPKEKFCFICHPNFIKGTNVHGPVAVGDCLSCHEPHSSDYPSLLKANRKSVCGICHKEDRLTKGMHDRASLREMDCMECHDPHYSNAPFFLR